MSDTETKQLRFKPKFSDLTICICAALYGVDDGRVQHMLTRRTEILEYEEAARLMKEADLPAIQGPA